MLQGPSLLSTDGGSPQVGFPSAARLKSCVERKLHGIQFRMCSVQLLSLYRLICSIPIRSIVVPSWDYLVGF